MNHVWSQGILHVKGTNVQESTKEDSAREMCEFLELKITSPLLSSFRCNKLGSVKMSTFVRVIGTVIPGLVICFFLSAIPFDGKKQAATKTRKLKTTENSFP